DMDSWPAPLLTIPNASSKDWLFLVSRLSDAFRLHPLPQNARLLDGKRLSAEKIASLIKKHLDPDSRKRFARVKYIEDLRAFLAWMENGKTYAVPISELPEADATTVVRWSLSRDRSHIKVWQESGNAFEIPWDDVLYHCEPQYDFYKGKQPGDANANVRQIGSRIRQLRQEKGYSVQRLAETIGMRRPNLSRLEHGHHQPSLDTLQKIAGALEVPVVELVARKR
ncbi:MAG: helix-turn-helix transcriptional regulator, partial [Chloroflexi bacterium]|nr:helix-turn-helix transcriptional regulator [Chloroflexota bacterium]